MAKEDILKFQREIIASMREEADSFQREADEKPDQVMVKVLLSMLRMARLGVTPDAFPTVEEKENVVLVWRKLSNFGDRCRSQLNEERRKQCADAVNAGNFLDLIQVLNTRLVHYRNHFILKKQYSDAKRKNAILGLVQWALVLVGTLLVGILASWANQNPSEGNLMLLMTVLGLYSLILIGGCFIAASKKVKNIPNLQSRVNNTAKSGFVQDHDFWKAVEEKFNGIPSDEQFLQTYKKQKAILEVIFPEEKENDAGNESPAESVIEME